jgi:hypothetical protein
MAENLPSAPTSAGLCHFCGRNPPDEAAKVTAPNTKTQRIRRCAECKGHFDQLGNAEIMGGFKFALPTAAVLVVVLVIVWFCLPSGPPRGPGAAGDLTTAVLVIILCGIGALCFTAFVWLLGAMRERASAKSALPYPMKEQDEVQAELDQQLTATDLIQVAGVDLPLSAVAAARWKDANSIAGPAAVLGPLASTEYSCGFLAISDRRLIVISFGVIVGDEFSLIKLEYAQGPVSWRVAGFLEQLTVTEEMNGPNVVLTIGGTESMLAEFPAAFDEANTTNARLIAEAIRTAKFAIGASSARPAKEKPDPEAWSEKTKGAVCFFLTVPLMLLGALLAFNNGNPVPWVGLPFLLLALASSVQAIRFRYHHYAGTLTPLAVWCAPILVSIFLVVAIIMGFGGK